MNNPQPPNQQLAFLAVVMALCMIWAMIVILMLIAGYG